MRLRRFFRIILVDCGSIRGIAIQSTRELNRNPLRLYFDNHKGSSLTYSINTSFAKKKEYVRAKLEQKSGKSLYSVVNKLLDREKEVILPNAKSDKELANNFLVYFKEKIEKIRSSFTPVSVSQSLDINPDIVKLTEFEPATMEEICTIVKSHGIKCSPEDPVPASLLASNVDTFAPFCG